MKKILALTLALMLALSLTAALAGGANNGENKFNLQVKVITVAFNDVTAGEAWNVDITGDDLTWYLNQKDTLSGTAEGWDPLKGNYVNANVDRTYETTLADGEKSAKEIIITNNSNFDVAFKCNLSKSTDVGNALTLGGQERILVNKAGESNLASVFVTLNPEDLSKNNPIKSGSVGSLIITLSKSGQVYPYNPEP